MKKGCLLVDHHCYERSLVASTLSWPHILAYPKLCLWEASHSVFQSILFFLKKCALSAEAGDTLQEYFWYANVCKGSSLGGLSPRWENPQDQLCRGQQHLHREQDSSNGYCSNCSGKFPPPPLSICSTCVEQIFFVSCPATCEWTRVPPGNGGIQEKSA